MDKIQQKSNAKKTKQKLIVILIYLTTLRAL